MLMIMICKFFRTKSTKRKTSAIKIVGVQPGQPVAKFKILSVTHKGVKVKLNESANQDHLK